MGITSHFIGIRLDNSVFIDLFIALQAYLEKNNITDSIELQDRHSLHVTLYYLPQILTSEESSMIKQDLHRLNQDNKDYRLNIKKYSYFKQQSMEFICYFDPSPSTKLVEWNTY